MRVRGPKPERTFLEMDELRAYSTRPTLEKNGETRNRTEDTTIFSRRRESLA
jgi:hypothetical protein